MEGGTYSRGNPGVSTPLPQYLLDTEPTKSNCEGILAHTMKTYRWSRGMAPFILNLTARWWWVVNFMPRLVCPGKEPW